MVGRRLNRASSHPVETWKCDQKTSYEGATEQSTRPDESNVSKPQILAANILCQLPRELRNRIHTFCVQGSYDNNVIVRRASRSESVFALLTRQCLCHHSYRWVEDPTQLIISAQVLGQELGREMVEAYYWTRTFKFTHRELSLLAPFLSTDRFGLGMIPACYARRIQIQFQPGIAVVSEEKQYLQALEILGAMLTARTEVIIDIELSEGRDDVDPLQLSGSAQEVSPKFAQAVHALERKGQRIVIKYSRSWSG